MNTVIQIFQVFEKRIPGLTKDQFLKEWCQLSREDRDFLYNTDLGLIARMEYNADLKTASREGAC